MVEESHVKSKKHTEANFLFVPFERYNLSEGMNPYALLKKMDEDVPHVSLYLNFKLWKNTLWKLRNFILFLDDRCNRN